MTLQQLKELIKAVPGQGITSPQLDLVADSAIESGYAAVWGSYEWKIRRRQKDTTTTANQAHTSLPVDFESLGEGGIRFRTTNTPWVIDLVSEAVFDTDHPNPALYSNAQPQRAKIVYDPSQADKWRIVWFRIPDTAYNISITYYAKADTAFFPNVPSYMQAAIIAKCNSLMRGQGQERSFYDSIAQQELTRAQYSDSVDISKPPRFGVDLGFNDCWNTGDYGPRRWPG